MKLWIRKIFVILVAIVTLGLYIPPINIDTNAESNEVDNSPSNEGINPITPVLENENKSAFSNDYGVTDYLIDELTEKAKVQAISKLGEKIKGQVEDEFMTEILPNIENVLEKVLDDAGEDKLPYYQITEHPAEGYGERIFNVYDQQTKRDIIRFHVRRDNRPLEGYWFNFHYHLSKDGFQEHHEIGEIYWAKNTPPKWMS